MLPDERLGLDLKRTEQQLIAAKAAAVRPFGLTVPQYAALYVLARNADISAAALARAVLVTPQAMAVLIRTLLDRGLVERSAHEWHRHVKQLRITAEGERLLALADAEAVRIERAIAEAFTPAERDTLRDLLERTRDAIAGATGGQPGDEPGEPAGKS